MTASLPASSGRAATPAIGAGKMLGRYELVHRLGAGGMAEVFLAVRHGAAGFRKAVALKRILPPFAKQAEFLRLLQREAGIAAMMHHPNCVQVNELQEVDGQFVLEMELLFGVTSAELLDAATAAGKRLPIGVAIRVVADAARGLHYVHELDDGSGHRFGIVHRDVSPQNALVTEDGVTKVLDFGIATAAEGLDSDTRTGVIQGKYHYVSPEQVRLKPLDARSDVWALGATLFELLVAEPLFGERPSAAETLQAVMEAPIRRPSALRPDVPPMLDDVVRDALQRDPLMRTPSAATLADQLDRLAARLPGSTPADVARTVGSYAGAQIEKLKSLAAAATRTRDPLAASGSHTVGASGQTPLDPPSASVRGAAAAATEARTGTLRPPARAEPPSPPPEPAESPARPSKPPPGPFDAGLDRAVAREQQTELLDVRKLTPRRARRWLDLALLLAGALVGWLVAWWLLG